MDHYSKFHSAVRSAAEKFKSLSGNGFVRIISHMDSDGISAASILIRAFTRLGNGYSLTVVSQLNSEFLEGLSAEDYKNYFFVDTGSSMIGMIAKHLKTRNVFILDHHEIEGQDSGEGIVHINSHLFNIDGGRDICSSGIAYYFCKALDTANADSAHLAIVGIIGETQDKQGLMPLNNQIIEDARDNGLIEINNGLRLFGTHSRPLHKVIEYSSELIIPGVTGDEKESMAFLKEIGIRLKNGNEWRKLHELNDDETRTLTAAIIERRKSLDNPSDIYGISYLIKNEENGSPFKDVREFSTILNACGRLGKASLGIGACLGNESLKRRAIQNLKDYKIEIVKAMNWYKKNMGSKVVVEERFVIINAEDNIMAPLIGTFSSLIAKTGEVSDNTFVLGMAQAIDNTTKISLRIAGKQSVMDVDLTEVMKEIINQLGCGETGGHKLASGAIIPTQMEKRFIDVAKEVLRRKSIEESVK